MNIKFFFHIKQDKGSTLITLILFTLIFVKFSLFIYSYLANVLDDFKTLSEIQTCESNIISKVNQQHFSQIDESLFRSQSFNFFHAHAKLICQKMEFTFIPNILTNHLLIFSIAKKSSTGNTIRKKILVEYSFPNIKFLLRKLSLERVRDG